MSPYGRNTIHLSVTTVLLLLALKDVSVDAFTTTTRLSSSSRTRTPQAQILRMAAAPQRLEENVNGPLYVNDRCINCSACAMFAPSVFDRSATSTSGEKHVVKQQPSTEEEMIDAQAALRACPVAAIRLENQAYRNHRNMPPLTEEEQIMVSTMSSAGGKDADGPLFPRRVSPNVDDVYFVGHHNSASFGAAPYLVKSSNKGWIMIDSPKYSKSAVAAIESLTGSGEGPSYMVLTHVDDTADHLKWHEQYPNMKRIFHSGDLGRHNWIGDQTLEDVELLHNLKSTDSQLQLTTLEGESVDYDTAQDHTDDVLIVHTPGHSPGSITLWKRSTSIDTNDGAIFTGDTYAYTTRDGGHMSGFPRYGNNLSQQAKTLKLLLDLDWHLVAPGHGHPRDYTTYDNDAIVKEKQEKEMVDALEELTVNARW